MTQKLASLPAAEFINTPYSELTHFCQSHIISKLFIVAFNAVVPRQYSPNKSEISQTHAAFFCTKFYD
jgi:hypothetical protein